MQDISLWLMGLLVAACGVSCSGPCGILVPGPGIEPSSPCIAKQILYWATREVPTFFHVHSLLALLSHKMGLRLGEIVTSKSAKYTSKSALVSLNFFLEMTPPFTAHPPSGSLPTAVPSSLLPPPASTIACSVTLGHLLKLSNM